MQQALLLFTALVALSCAATCDCLDNAACEIVVCPVLNASQAPPTMHTLLGSLLVADLNGTLSLGALRNVSGSIMVTAAALSSFDAPTLHTVGGALQITGVSMLTSVSLPALVSVGSLEVSDCAALVSLTVGQLARTGDLSFRNLAALPSLSLPLLATSGALDLTAAGCTLFSAPVLALLTGSLQVVNNAALSQLSLPALASVSRALVITNNTALTTLSLGALVTVTNVSGTALSIFSNPALCNTCSLCPLALANSSSAAALPTNALNSPPFDNWTAFSAACGNGSNASSCDSCLPSTSPSFSASPSPSIAPSRTSSFSPSPSFTPTPSRSFSAGVGAAYAEITLVGMPDGFTNTDAVLDAIQDAMLAAGVSLATVGLTGAEKQGVEMTFTMRFGAVTNDIALVNARAFQAQIKSMGRIGNACTPACTVYSHVYSPSAGLRQAVSVTLVAVLLLVAAFFF